MVVAKGGRHGLGNMHWASSTHQVPEETRPGGAGEDFELRLDLKVIADVGLAGFPNAGKSTLLSRISAARPKIADYPFTTLVPNLGVVDVDGDGEFDYNTFVMADIPGLIEGASTGRGLGLQFLKHLERTSLILYMLDAADFERTPAEALAILRKELQAFSPELAAKRMLVVINKIDALDDEMLAAVRDPIVADGYDVLAISAVTGVGLKQLCRHVYKLVQAEKQSRGDGDDTPRDFDSFAFHIPPPPESSPSAEAP